MFLKKSTLKKSTLKKSTLKKSTFKKSGAKYSTFFSHIGGFCSTFPKVDLLHFSLLRCKKWICSTFLYFVAKSGCGING